MPAPLTESEFAHYWEHGFMLVRGLVDRESCARYAQRLEEIVRGRVPPAKRMLVMRDVMVVRGAVTPQDEMGAVAKIQDFENDEVLDGYNRDERVLDAVEQIIGPDIQTIHCMLINKPPGVDGRHPLHQDLVYFPFRPADGIVASWTPLERVTRENGGLVVVSGSHRGPLYDHENMMDWEYVNAAYWGAKGVGPETPRVHVEAEPGDTLFFHPLVLHGSGRNRTSGYRRVISCHYASTRLQRIWDETEGGDASRWFRTVRGREPDSAERPSGAPRPGQPAYTFPTSRRRS